MSYTIHNGDCVSVLAGMDENIIDTCITDPPYELGFMGKRWDSSGVAFRVATWEAVYRVLKPGALLLAFGGTRTYHRMVCAIEDAGFEIRDTIAWVYGCLDAETHVATIDGVKPHHKTKIGDLVLCYNPENGEYSYQPILEIVEYEYSDTAYRLVGDLGEQVVSRNHRCIIERGGREVFELAETLQQQASVPFLESLPELRQAIHDGECNAVQDERRAQGIRAWRGHQTSMVRVVPFHYTGKVWCLRVPTGAFVAVRNGAAFPTGNSGFPKSLSISKSLDKREENLWNNISKTIDNLNKDGIIQAWKKNLSGVKFAETQYQKSLTEAGINTPKNDFAQERVLLSISPKNSYANAIIAELSSCEAQRYVEGYTRIAQESVEQPSAQLQSGAKSVGNTLQDPRVSLDTTTSIAQQSVKDMLKESSTINHRAEEALKIYCGNLKSLNEQAIGALFAELINDWKLITLSQSKTFRNLDTKSQMECASATTVIITESIAECLISFMVDILKSKAIDKQAGAEREVLSSYEREGRSAGIMGNKVQIVRDITAPATPEAQLWDGWGTALKPAHESIVVAMKPIDGTFVNNALTWGVAGLWIDGGRVGTEGARNNGNSHGTVGSNSIGVYGKAIKQDYHKGRFPANLILSYPEDEYELRDDVTPSQLMELARWFDENA